ncbi:MAG TPA: hypothetical protein VIY52_32425 [Streptosporangiaceae bacterium]
MVAALGWGTAGIAVGDEVFGLTDPYRDAAAAAEPIAATPTEARCRRPVHDPPRG